MSALVVVIVARRILPWLVYPALSGASVAAFVALVRCAVPLGIALVAATGGVAAALVLLERWMPYRRAWQAPRGDRLTDVGHMVSSNAALELVRAASYGPLIALGSRFARSIGAPEPSRGLWPHSLPIAAQCVLALVLLELGGYWSHRLQHSVPQLWRLHAPHHSAPRLYFLTGVRNHAGDVVLSGVLGLLPLTALGVSDLVLGVVATFAGAHFMLQHANVDVRLGRANWLISGPEIHRWHHSPRIEDTLCNYGGILLIWDGVFRTRRSPPRDRELPSDLGLLDTPSYPLDLWGQLTAPFLRR